MSTLKRLLTPVILFAATTALADLPPLPIQLIEALNSVVPDPLPKQLAADAHFVVSDEGAHWLFRETILNIGGVMMGVGSDQNYLLAGWARPDLLILVDFDQVVVDVHAIYREIFIRCADPATFLSYWSLSRMKEVEEWLSQAYTDTQQRRRIIATFRASRNLIEWRLKTVKKIYRERKVPTFLEDQEQYSHLRSLFKAHRVFAIRGDLTGKSAIRAIANALRGAQMKVTVLYLSNAEKYFDFTKDYKANMRAIPFAENAVVLRTAGGWDPELAQDGLYTYIVQPAWSFVAWMQDDVRSSFKLLVSKRKHDPSRPGLATITAVPNPNRGKKR